MAPFLLNLLLGLGAGCSSGADSAPFESATPAADSTVESDTGADTASDSGSETAVETGADSGGDSATDTSSDTSAPDECTLVQVWIDADGDGIGGPATLTTCTPAAGMVLTPGDCDDGDPAAFPGAPERCNHRDDDCNGAVDDATLDAHLVYEDADGDGFGRTADAACFTEPGWTEAPGDCDDTRSDVSPNAPELCDGADNDCDGLADVDALDASAWYPDTDADTYGDPATITWSCSAPAATVANADDCDDTDATTYPGAPTGCAKDQDCDGKIGDADADSNDPLTGWLDVDGDAFGNIVNPATACTLPADYVTTDGDCDDTDPLVYPGAGELCATGDEDCDGLEAEDDPDILDASDGYTDHDGDGFGDPSTRKAACELPVGSVADNTDCNDGDATINPDGVELCAAGDEDCDGLHDDADPDVSDPTVWYADADGDTFGDATVTITACVAAATTTDDDDCDDADANTHPNAVETCDDGINQDCIGGDQSCKLEGDIGINSTDVAFFGSGLGGGSVGSAGDVDGDGMDDVLLGAEANSAVGPQGGGVYVAFGVTTGSLDLTTTAVLIEPDSAGDHLGASTTIGDIDGDGLADVVVGGYLADPAFGGGAWYFSGATLIAAGATITTTSADAYFPGANAYDYTGITLADAGDTDGDGFNELLVGATGNSASGYHAGCTYLVAGEVWTGTQDLTLSTATLRGHRSGAHSAGSVDSAGDFNGDGSPDLLIGAEAMEATRGAAYVLFSPVAGIVDLSNSDLTLRGEAGGDLAGTDVALAGDTDGDGYPDVLVGADSNTDNGYDAGAAYLVLGGRTTSIYLSAADALIEGASEGSQAGHSVAGLGDLDADGLADFAVGAWHDSTLGHYDGSIGVFYGPVSGTMTLDASDARVWGSSSIGATVGGAGDTDGDGYDELVIGSPEGGGGHAWLLRGTGR